MANRIGESAAALASDGMPAPIHLLKNPVFERCHVDQDTHSYDVNPGCMIICSVVGIKDFLSKVGHFQRTLFACLLYFLLWVPMGMLTLLCSDWLGRRAPIRSNWRPRHPRVNDPSSVREPY